MRLRSSKTRIEKVVAFDSSQSIILQLRGVPRRRKLLLGLTYNLVDLVFDPALPTQIVFQIKAQLLEDLHHPQ